MSEKLTFKLLSREQHNSDFDWMNIDRGETRVGKVRGLIEGKKLTINSINIFPEFERHGYAKETRLRCLKNRLIPSLQTV